MARDLLLGDTAANWARGESTSLGAVAPSAKKTDTGQKVALVAATAILGTALVLGLKEASSAYELAPVRRN